MADVRELLLATRAEIHRFAFHVKVYLAIIAAAYCAFTVWIVFWALYYA